MVWGARPAGPPSMSSKQTKWLMHSLQRGNPHPCCLPGGAKNGGVGWGGSALQQRGVEQGLEGATAAADNRGAAV